MYSVKFDSVELVNSTYNLQFAQDHSAPERSFVLVPLSSDDGAIIVSSRYNQKTIRVKGFISAATPAALQTAVDTFKEIFSRRDKNLDITPQGGTLRRYVANCINHTLTGDFYNNTFLPYEAEFLVASAVGKSTSYETQLNATHTADYSVSNNFTVGSAPPKPIFGFTLTTLDGCTGILILNQTLTDISDSIIVTLDGFSNGDVLWIDCDAKTVKKNTTEVKYYGTFPRYIIGANTVLIQYSQILIEQNASIAASNTNSVYGVNEISQSFMVKHTDATYKSLLTRIKKTGSPPNNLIVTIEGDNSGAPDGIPIATFTVTAASLTTSLANITSDNASNFTLTGNTKYWIRCKTTDGDASNCYNIERISSNVYSKGNFATSSDSGVNWTDDYNKDMYFKLFFGGKKGGSMSIGVQLLYYPRYL